MSDTTDMKFKSVAYRSLFDPEEVIVAGNKMLNFLGLPSKLKDEAEQLRWSGIGSYEHFLREKSKGSKCKCRHPLFAGGMCHYRTCRHSVETHA